MIDAHCNGCFHTPTPSADTWQGRELDPARILGAQRHGEWAGALQPPKPAPGLAWGVAALPPGMEGSDERMKQVLKRQQGR